MVKFIHAADFHLDSAFGALPEKKAAARRRESRENAFRLADYVNDNDIELVLLAGDLFDSSSAFRETGEQLSKALGAMKARVFIAPGNHDWYGPGSPWLRESWPENVTIFTKDTVEAVEVPEWNLVLHGGAFTSPEQTRGLLTDFTAPADGRVHLGLFHGEIDPPQARYGPISRQEAAGSGLSYLALGHVHKRTEPLLLGGTLCAWPGCLEGRGFDELGEKGFYQGSIADDGRVKVQFVPFAWRRYERLEVDVTGGDPLAAVEAALPEDTARHLYRIVLTGETAEGGVDAALIEETLAPRFYALEVRDGTRMAEDIWQRAEEDSLRGLFLRELREKWRTAQSEEARGQITRAVRFGLAALDHRDLG